VPVSAEGEITVSDPKKDEIAKRHAIALLRYLSNCNGEPQLVQLTEAFRSALTDYEALRETSGPSQAALDFALLYTDMESLSQFGWSQAAAELVTQRVRQFRSRADAILAKRGQ
jgi:hypothetical protein